MKSGPIIIVEDDPEDQELFVQALQEIAVPNRIVWFQACDAALQYLRTTEEQPFVIFSDINLPVQNGLEFKQTIDSDEKLRCKSIPFVFFSTVATQADVNDAYTKMTVQGFFKKPSDYAQLKKELGNIIEYWKNCRHPNTDAFD